MTQLTGSASASTMPDEHHGFVRSTLLALLGALGLLWPALVNGGPFWFPDTSSYVRAADAAVVYLTGAPSEWSDRLAVDSGATAAASTPEPTEAASAVSPPLQPTRPVLVGRSIYYGFLIYLPMRVSGAWGAVLVQALLVASILTYALTLLQRTLGLVGRRLLLWLALALLMMGPLPFYASMLMPDVYTGLLMLCLATVLALWPRLRTLDRAVLLVLCAGIATFHTTHLLIGAAMGLAAAVFGLGGRRLRALAVIAPVLAVGAASVLTFNWAVDRALDQAPVSPPFLSARITAAGPGTEFLHERCGQPGADFVLCRWRDRLPAHSDAFLWDEAPESGIYQLFSDTERERASREDRRFFLTVFAYDPLGFIRACLRALGEQLIDFDMEGFNLEPPEARDIDNKYPQAIAEGIRGTLAERGAFPLTPVSWLTAVATLMSLAALFVASRQNRRAEGKQQALRWWAALLLIGVLANAALCGALSGPHGRYQMRLIWLLPLAAVVATRPAKRRDVFEEQQREQVTSGA